MKPLLPLVAIFATLVASCSRQPEPAPANQSAHDAHAALVAARKQLAALTPT